MKKILIIIGGFVLLMSACKPKEIAPPTLNLSSQMIDLGAITMASTSSLTLTQNGEGTIAYTINSNKSWLKLSKSSATIMASDVVNLSTVITATDLTEGDNTATLTVTPTINGVLSPAVTVAVKGIFKTTTVAVATTTVDFGTITANKSVFVKIAKVGTENLTYDVTSDKTWLMIDKTTGTLTATDSLRLTANTQTLPSGNQTATLTITPKVNGVAGKPSTIAVKVNYDDAITGNIEKRTLTKNETWGGAINLNGSVVVPKGFTLTIRPGTKIRVRAIPTDRILLEINGKLLMNGDASNIIELRSANATPSNRDWQGIEANGDIEVSYCFIKDANAGLDFLFSPLKVNATKAPVIHHCLFDNCFNAIAFFSSNFESTLYNLTFRRLGFTSLTTNDVKKLTLNDTELLSTSSDIGVYSTGLDFKINNANFVAKQYVFYENIFVSDAIRHSNNNVTITNCFGFSTAGGFERNGNVFTNTTPAKTANSKIGCGFIDKYPASGRMAAVVEGNEMSAEEILAYKKKLYLRLMQK